MPLVEGLPVPYSAIPPRRRKAQPAPRPTATALARHASRRSPPAPVASTSRLPTTADELRRAFRPSRVGRGASRCPAECCERPLLFAEDGDDIASGPASPSAAWTTRPTLGSRSAAAVPKPWSALVASLTASPSSSSLGSPPILSGSADSSASSLLLTPPDELAAFAFAKAAARATAIGRPPRQIGRRTGDSLVEELEGGFEWALGRALGSLKGSLAMGLPIRGSRRRSRGRAASAGKTTLATNGGSTSTATPEIGPAPPGPGTSDRRPLRRTRSPSSTRLPVLPGSCPLTRPRSPSPIRPVAPSLKSPPARTILTPATSPPRSIGLAHLFAILPPQVVLLWPASGAVSSTPAKPRSSSATLLPCEAYRSSLPLLPMSRPPTPAQVLRPHFPVLRPRALERYVVFGHMRRAGKIGQQGAGGDVEWRRVRERQRVRGEGSALRWEL